MNRIAQILASELTDVEKSALIEVINPRMDARPAHLMTLSELRLIELPLEGGSATLTTLGAQVFELI